MIALLVSMYAVAVLEPRPAADHLPASRLSGFEVSYRLTENHTPLVDGVRQGNSDVGVARGEIVSTRTIRWIPGALLQEAVFSTKVEGQTIRRVIVRMPNQIERLTERRAPDGFRDVGGVVDRPHLVKDALNRDFRETVLWGLWSARDDGRDGFGVFPDGWDGGVVVQGDQMVELTWKRQRQLDAPDRFATCIYTGTQRENAIVGWTFREEHPGDVGPDFPWMQIEVHESVDVNGVPMPKRATIRLQHSIDTPPGYRTRATYLVEVDSYRIIPRFSDNEFRIHWPERALVRVRFADDEELELRRVEKAAADKPIFLGE
jgi:hypothetical protein